MTTLIDAVYVLTAFLFIVGLQRMSSPRSARSGVRWAGAAMLLAVVVTLTWPGLQHRMLIVILLGLGSGAAWIAARRVSMTGMPQMIAIYNGMGGGAAAAIGALELLRSASTRLTLVVLATIGSLIGAAAFSGSVIAFARLQGVMDSRPTVFRGQQVLNALCALAALGSGFWFLTAPSPAGLAAFFATSLLYGILMTLPIGGGDMPVVISLYNALTGLAVAFEGFALHNAAMIIAGTVVGAAGALLTLLMARAMNRTLANILFSGFGQTQAGAGAGTTGSLKSMEIPDAAILLRYARTVIIVPGYGMAVAQAQHKVRELAELLTQAGLRVKFAVHPVAGRMPGHMNVLLAEAGIAYDDLYDLEVINADFPSTDVSIVIGANDVVNPAARTNRSSPIYGMPILNVDASKNVLIIKRGQGKGFAGIENELFSAKNAHMVYGDAQSVVNALVQDLKPLL